MSAVDREYQSTRMSRAEESAMVDCPNCEATHPPKYQLIPCNHKHCDIKGCHECIVECSASVQCGRFCSDHLVEVELGAEWCYRCVAETLDEGDGLNEDRVALEDEGAEIATLEMAA